MLTAAGTHDVPDWDSSDAWVFAAIEGTCADDGYSLVQIVGKGDGINHAILMEEEFTQAVPRLVHAGLIGADVAADRYWHTEAGRELYSTTKGLFNWTSLVPALKRLGPPHDDDGWHLAPGVFRRAVRKYRGDVLPPV